MSFRIKTTREAESTFNQNLDYLEKEWNNEVMIEFLNRVDQVVETINENPFLFPLVGYENDVRKATINKRITLYYRIIDEVTIELLSFWNNYRDPTKMTF